MIQTALFPQLGCLGAGFIVPEYEVEPAEELAPYLNCLALRSEPLARWYNDPSDSIRPWGAGLGVSRPVAEGFARACAGSALTEGLGRTGTSLVPGEDDEFAWQACAQGLGKGFFPELRLRHLIPARRVEKSYLLKLVRGQAYSDLVLDYVHGREPSIPARPSTFREVASAFCSGRLSTALGRPSSYWGWKHKPQVQEALASVAAQTYPRWELIAVDDAGPDDGTEAAVVAFALAHPEHHVVWVRHEVNRGAAAARNTALSLASGGLVAPLDPDDVYLPERLALQVKFLMVHPPVGVVGSDARDSSVRGG